MSDERPSFQDVPFAVMGPPEILSRAMAESKRLAAQAHWKPAFERSHPETPVLVSRLDQADRYYYVVSFRSPVGVTARLRMHAHTGRFSEGIGVDNLTDSLAPHLNLDQVRRRAERLAGAETTKKKTVTRKKPLPPPISIEPFLVWKPCAQSFSAFLPFYRINWLKRSWYCRVDGKVYEELTLGAGL